MKEEVHGWNENIYFVKFGENNKTFERWKE